MTRYANVGHPNLGDLITDLYQGAQMRERCLCPDFELRGQTYEIWTDSISPSNRVLCDPRARCHQQVGHEGMREVVDTDHAFDPPLTNDELLAIYDYGKGY